MVKTQYVCTIWKTRQDTETVTKFRHLFCTYAGKEHSQVRCLLGKNVGVAKMPEVRLTVDYTVTPEHLKSPRVVLPTALFFLLRQKFVEG